MSHKYFEQTRVRKLTLPASFDTNRIRIGIPVDADEAALVGLYNVGESVLPSADFGCVSKRNACGDEYADKSQPKKRRYINTIWVQPFGNDYASPSPVDVYKKCYPKVMVPPTEIEFVLYENSQKKQFVLADLTQDIRENHLVDAVNLFLEIYGRCYVFNEEIDIQPIKNVVDATGSCFLQERNQVFIWFDSLRSKARRMIHLTSIDYTNLTDMMLSLLQKE